MSKNLNNQEAPRKRVYPFFDLHPKENKRLLLITFAWKMS